MSWSWKTNNSYPKTNKFFCISNYLIRNSQEICKLPQPNPNPNTPNHSDAEIENFGHLHLEYRYGYHFVAHDRLIQKNILGGLKGVFQKTAHMVYMGGRQNSFFSILWG
jgi:hypothetical protein